MFLHRLVSIMTAKYECNDVFYSYIVDFNERVSLCGCSNVRIVISMFSVDFYNDLISYSSLYGLQRGKVWKCWSIAYSNNSTIVTLSVMRGTTREYYR